MEEIIKDLDVHFKGKVSRQYPGEIINMKEICK
jgi:hypothetical protein